MPAYAPKVPSILSFVREIEKRPQPIVGFGREYPSGHLIERHSHDRAQLIYASHGVMRVDTPHGIWVVPPMRAIWVPPKTEHEIRAFSLLRFRTLFIKPSSKFSLPRECCVIEVSPLLRELILRMVDMSASNPPAPVSIHLVGLILEEIRQVDTLPLHLGMPNDARARRICLKILQNPANSKTCSEWGASVGASARTLDRLFQKETGMSFGSWRRHVLLLDALSRLASATPIATVALDLGYRSPSAFTAMFKRTMGRTPREFFQ